MEKNSFSKIHWCLQTRVSRKAQYATEVTICRCYLCLSPRESMTETFSVVIHRVNLLMCWHSLNILKTQIVAQLHVISLPLNIFITQLPCGIDKCANISSSSRWNSSCNLSVIQWKNKYISVDGCRSATLLHMTRCRSDPAGSTNVQLQTGCSGFTPKEQYKSLLTLKKIITQF